MFFYFEDKPELCSKMYRKKYVKKASITFSQMTNQNTGQITSLPSNLANQPNYSRVAEKLRQLNIFALNQSTNPSIGSRGLRDIIGLGNNHEFHNSTAATNQIFPHVGSGTIPNIFNNQMFTAYSGNASTDALSLLGNLQNFVDTGYGINHGSTLMANSRADCLKPNAYLILQQKLLRQQEMLNQTHLKTFDQQKLANALAVQSRSQQLQSALRMNPTLLTSNGVANLPSAVESFGNLARFAAFGP